MAEQEQHPFKYIAVRNWILDNIKTGVFKYGERIPSENFLCRKFHVSRQTIRNAIDELESQGILKRNRGSGTYVNKTYVNASHTIGVLLSYTHNILFAPIIQGIEDVASSMGYGMELGITNNSIEKERAFLKRMLQMNVAGLIAEGTRSALPSMNVTYYEELRQRGIPIVFIHNGYTNFPCPSFVMADEDLAYTMTKMLIHAGHTKIAGLFKGDDEQGHLRYKGYIRALSEACASVEEQKIGWFYSNYYGNELLDKTVEHIMSDFHDYTALVCYNDYVAESVWHYLEKQGLKIYDDVSVVSFDNLMNAQYIGPGITSAEHPQKLIGIEAAVGLMKMIREGMNQIPNKKIILQTQICVRSSIKTIKNINQEGSL